MDENSVKHIQASANLPLIVAMIEDNCTLPCALIPEGYRIESLEDKNGYASHYRMRYETDSLEDFIEYCSTHAIDGSACFVDPIEMKATAIIDLGTLQIPGHKYHTAKFFLNKTASYISMLDNTDTKLNQRSASDFIDDWSDFISVRAADGTPMDLGRAAARLRNMTIETAKQLNSQVGDMSQQMSAMERVEASKPETMPATIIFKCVPYFGLTTREFKLRVQVVCQDTSAPRVIFRLVAHQEATEQMSEEMKEIIVQGLSATEIKARIGTVS
jgi:uncharacterized protein YfdQ (DUF2303 family)